MIKKILLISVLSFVSKIAFSQEINLFIKDVKEERRLEQENSHIELTAIVKGLKVDDSNRIKIKEVAAIDSEGNALQKVEDFFGDDYNNRNEIKLKLEAPSRSAIKISSLEGVIQSFNPSENNGSKLIISNPLNYYNTNLLGKNNPDVKLTLIDKDAIKKLKDKDDKEYTKQIKKLKNEGGLGEGLADTVDAFKLFFEGFASFGSEESLSFYIEDDNDKIVEILVYNAKGEKMNYGRGQMGNKLTINLKEKVASDWKIEILIENEKSVKEYKFNLANIILP